MLCTKFNFEEESFINTVDIAEALRQRGYYKGASKEIIRDIFEIISESLVRGDNVVIRNFGFFELKTVKGHAARDPITNEIRPYEDYEKLSFRPSENLREYVKKAARMSDEDRKQFAIDLYSKKLKDKEEQEAG